MHDTGDIRLRISETNGDILLILVLGLETEFQDTMGVHRVVVEVWQA
jgi:hypothetical protein